MGDRHSAKLMRLHRLAGKEGVKHSGFASRGDDLEVGAVSRVKHRRIRALWIGAAQNRRRSGLDLNHLGGRGGIFGDCDVYLAAAADGEENNELDVRCSQQT
jgi:hypothetical protein